MKQTNFRFNVQSRKRLGHQTMDMFTYTVLFAISALPETK